MDLSQKISNLQSGAGLFFWHPQKAALLNFLLVHAYPLSPSLRLPLGTNSSSQGASLVEGSFSIAPLSVLLQWFLPEISVELMLAKAEVVPQLTSGPCPSEPIEH